MAFLNDFFEHAWRMIPFFSPSTLQYPKVLYTLFFPFPFHLLALGLESHENALLIDRVAFMDG